MSEPTESEVVLRLVDNLKQATGCCWQLLHIQQNSNWMIFRDLLEQVTQDVAALATAKPMARQVLLQNVDQRAKEFKVPRAH